MHAFASKGHAVFKRHDFNLWNSSILPGRQSEHQPLTICAIIRGFYRKNEAELPREKVTYNRRKSFASIL